MYASSCSQEFNILNRMIFLKSGGGRGESLRLVFHLPDYLNIKLSKYGNSKYSCSTTCADTGITISVIPLDSHYSLMLEENELLIFFTPSTQCLHNLCLSSSQDDSLN